MRRTKYLCRTINGIKVYRLKSSRIKIKKQPYPVSIYLDTFDKMSAGEYITNLSARDVRLIRAMVVRRAYDVQQTKMAGKNTWRLEKI